ncbi:MAG TPA: TrbI/VirB10 family protein [Alphaproteobacteria bacterium]
MRTDDFEDDIVPGDPNEPRPDKQPIDVDDGESFNEFDQPSAQGGNSLGELWRNNPLIKIAVVSIGAVLLIAGYLMFGGGGGDAPKSTVGTPLQQSEAPGAATTPAYTQAINDVNQQRLNAAMQSGGSSIPIPTAGNDVADTQPVEEEPPVTLQDPLADWRAAVQQPVEQGPTLQQPQQGSEMPHPYPNQQQQMAPLGPDPEAVNALAQAMNTQMAAILDKHKIDGAKIMTVTSADYFKQQAEANGGTETVVPEEEEIEEILVPAGTIAYAQTLTEANSDVPGPVLARIASGPLTGSRVLGDFQTTEEKLVLKFNKVVIKGVTYPIQAVALDPKTTLPGVATDVDHRYWKRFILPAAASFIEGMGEAIAQREQTVVVTGDTAVSSQPDLNTKEELAAGFAEGTANIADELDDEGDSVQPLVRVHAGTPVGILFLEPVIKND